MTTRYQHAVLIDGTGGPPVADAVLVVDDDGLVVHAGPAATAPRPTPAATTVDLGGRTVLPGFFDCHAHLCMTPERGLVAGLAADPTVDTFEIAERLRATLQAGVTTVRDLGGIPAGYRTALERGLIEGPRLQVAVKVISHTGGHADCSLPGGVDAAPHLGEIADTADEARIAARRVLRAGADVVKVCATGGMGSPHDDPDDEGLTYEELRAVVDEAARHRGKPVAVHAQGGAGIRNALRAGVTSIEHGYGMTDELCDLALAQDAFLVPTLSTVFAPLDPAAMPEYHYRKKTRWSGISKENIAHAIERGVPVALGTDAGVVPHARNLLELSYLVELGMDPLDAITAGTLNAARLLRLDDRLGSLEAGKTADFVVVDGDPLHDIALLGRPENILLVAQSGIVRKNLL
ncbi:imidazolonepropionase-like amidohydrolase [Streptomyces sp. LBL]|uniref:metal-dependent hydrolase family protein n=1 Tax=Streptomyces sp. LBL TaxID=2940562 RepID=UPI0024742130|nr:amidohydrolase family protein [Streptomyces sp. LBL]MDH6625819.1 imidazolonepropionase-like amidohydrolase [Streptomyces sp. LBL]